MDAQKLLQIGFEEKEAKSYLALLQLGPSSASSVAQQTGFERTSTYYLLLRMLEKGYVSQSIRKNVKTFTATDPDRLLDRLKEQESVLQEILPQLNKLKTNPDENIAVEVRQGKEGFKHLYRDAISVGKEVCGLGVDDGQYIDFDELSINKYYKDAAEKNMTERLITYEGATTYGSDITEYRTIPRKYFQPTPTFIYGDRVVLVSWIPTINLIFIISEELADSYRKHFEFMWITATPYKKLTAK